MLQSWCTVNVDVDVDVDVDLKRHWAFTATPRSGDFSRLRDEGSLAADLAAFTLGEAAPDAEPLALGNGELETFGLDGTGAANRLCLASRCAAFGKEQILICPAAVRKVLPGQFVEDEGLDQLGVHFPPLTDV